MYSYTDVSSKMQLGLDDFHTCHRGQRVERGLGC